MCSTTSLDVHKFRIINTLNFGINYEVQSDADTFRIKIWYEEGDLEIVVYDNGMDQEIGGGSIVVHTKK